MGFEPADRLAQDVKACAGALIKLKQVLKLPFAEDLLAAYCAFDKQTPRHAAALLWGDCLFHPAVRFRPRHAARCSSFTDDAAILATAIQLVAGHITQESRRRPRR